MSSNIDDPLPHNQSPFFPQVTVILGDPRLPDESKIEHRFSREDLDAIDKAKAALQELKHYQFTYLDNHLTLLSTLSATPPGFVLNFCDTGYKNQARQEPHIPALLEMFDIPYSGAGPICLGLCYDKSLVRAVARTHGIPVPVEHFISSRDREGAIPTQFPAFIKPNGSDGSLGISEDSLVNNVQQTHAYLNKLRTELPGRDLLIQEFLPGAEYSIGVLGNPGLGVTVLPILEVDYSKLESSGLPPLLSYASKIDPESPYWSDLKYTEARLDEPTRQRLVGYCMFLFERLGCRDYARFDFRTDARGEIKLLEVNPNPAWCWDGKLNLMTGFAGYRYATLLERILQVAQTRSAKNG
jgi:D-alanine-D-alanine ligase